MSPSGPVTALLEVQQETSALYMGQVATCEAVGVGALDVGGEQLERVVGVHTQAVVTDDDPLALAVRGVAIVDTHGQHGWLSISKWTK